MKSKKLIPIIAAFMLAGTLLPVGAHAAELDHSIGGSCSVAMEVGSVCHCGGIRQSTIESFTVYQYCEEHKGACNRYMTYDKEYFYCSNPYCTDTWYGDPIVGTVKLYHEHN